MYDSLEYISYTYIYTSLNIYRLWPLLRFIAAVAEDLWVTLKEPIVQSDRPTLPNSLDTLYTMKCICSDCKMHLYKLQNIFFQTAKDKNVLTDLMILKSDGPGVHRIISTLHLHTDD